LECTIQKLSRKEKSSSKRCWLKDHKDQPVATRKTRILSLKWSTPTRSSTSAAAKRVQPAKKVTPRNDKRKNEDEFDKLVFNFNN